MVWIAKCAIRNNFKLLQNIHFKLGIFNCKKMSVKIDNLNTNDIDALHSNNKRPMLDEDDQNELKVQKVEIQRVRRKTFALMLGYLGKDYYGMQRNPGMKTIEEELLTALLKADLITTEIFENIRIIGFQRAARTDKGVSAIRQIVSIKLPEEANKSQINQHLPKEIRVFGLKRVTKNFNCKTQCNARTYRYILPTFAFASEDLSLLPTPKEYDFEKRLTEVSVINGEPYTNYRLSPENLDKLNTYLQAFEGTHNFHNFTSRVKPLDPRAIRYIINFRCSELFEYKNIEFAILEIKGQSFMLHQIRKMVATIVGIARNFITKDTINKTFQEQKFDIPIAPGLGLILNYIHYDYYNNRYGTDGIHEKLEWTECDEEVEKFQKEYILKYITDTEILENVTLNWLASLPQHTFAAREEETIAL